MYKALEQSISQSEKLAALSDFAYRVWVQGLAASDMVGRITGNPKTFWAQAMPLVEYEQTKVSRALDELTQARLIHRYDVEGKAYIVFHDHEDYNKGTRNLRHPPKSKLPPPPQNLCHCIAYQNHEQGGATAVTTAVRTAVPTAIVPVPVHVHVPVHVQEGESEGEPKESTRFLAVKWNKGPGLHLNGDKAAQHIQAAMDVGVDPQVIDQHFSDHKAIKGRRIWEVLDPLRPFQAAPGVKSIQEILNDFGKKGTG